MKKTVYIEKRKKQKGGGEEWERRLRRTKLRITASRETLVRLALPETTKTISDRNESTE